MATTQKKTSGGGKRTSTSGWKGKSSSSRGGGNRSAKPAGRPIRREVGAAVCLVLALFSAFGYFDVQALFIDFFCGLLKGLIGYGYWIVPPALLMGFYILAFHRGRPVRLRLACTLLLPLMFGILMHLFLAEPYTWSKMLVSQLWESGNQLASGGVVGGVIAIAGIQVFSRAGTAVVLIIGAAFMVLAACNRNILDVIDYFRDRPRPEYEPQEERRPRSAAQQPAEEPRQPRPRRQVLDIPVEDGPLVGKQPEPPLPVTEKRGSFFNRRPNVKTPDELLAERTSVGAEAEAPAAGHQEEIQPPPEPQALEMEPVQPAETPEIIREPAVPKSSKEETARAAAEVARDIQESMESSDLPYQYPPLSLLKEGESGIGSEALVELSANKQRLSDTIHSFGIDANITNVTRGPSVTRYELELDQGVRLNKLTNLADDIALALGASGVRIAPIPDKISMVGIEVPNKMVSPVSIRTVIGSKEFTDSTSKVSFAVGKDISGNCIVGNIARLPHLLIAGTTGSGKSVCTNSLIVSLLYKATPDEVRLIMVDPKMVELGIYNGIPHLLIPVVTDPKKAAGALQWAVTEMMKRYRTFSEVGVRDLAAYNSKASRTPGMEKMPQIVIIIDELADLMLVAAKEVEESICRVAQMGRASGMHLVIATQRPSADVITGLMKANIPSRIAFAVASAMESRIILDTMGAEKLVGRGDMLYFPLGTGKPTRVQGCFISDEEVAAVVDFVKQSGTANYSDEVMHEIEQHAAEKDKGSKGVGGPAAEEGGEEYDELLPSAIEVVVETGQASVSMLQRRLKLGYARAARLVDQMEEKGVVGPFEGSKPRQLLITKEQWQEMQYRQGIAPAPTAGEQPAGEGEGDLPPFDLPPETEREDETVF